MVQVFVVLLFCLFFQTGFLSLFGPGCPETHFCRVSLNSDLPASPRVLGLKSCTTTAHWNSSYLKNKNKKTKKNPNQTLVLCFKCFQIMSLLRIPLGLGTQLSRWGAAGWPEVLLQCQLFMFQEWWLSPGSNSQDEKSHRVCWRPAPAWVSKDCLVQGAQHLHLEKLVAIMFQTTKNLAGGLHS